MKKISPAGCFGKNQILLRLSASLLFLVSSVSGCGNQADSGLNLNLSIQPQSVIIGPGPRASCTDLNTAADERSVSGPLVSFNNFVFEWLSTDDLYVSLIRVKIEGAGIQNGSQTIEINSEETEYLLGRPGGYINGRLPASGRTLIQSLDPNRRRDADATQDQPSGALSPCSLVVGGIQLTNGSSTPSFTAVVTVDVIGTGRVTTGPDKGKEYFVRESTTGLAEYFSY